MVVLPKQSCKRFLPETGEWVKEGKSFSLENWHGTGGLHLSGKHVPQVRGTLPVYNAHLQVVILDNDLGTLVRMQNGVHRNTTGASARSWWTPTPASWYSFCGPPECNGGPAEGISCWKTLDFYNRVGLATLVGRFQPSHAWLLR